MKKYENNNIYYRYYPIINIEDEYNKDRGYCDNLKIPCKIRLYDSSNNYTDIPFD
jgi:hypothetical protein